MGTSLCPFAPFLGTSAPFPLISVNASPAVALAELLCREVAFDGNAVAIRQTIGRKGSERLFSSWSIPIVFPPFVD